MVSSRYTDPRCDPWLGTLISSSSETSLEPANTGTRYSVLPVFIVQADRSTDLRRDFSRVRPRAKNRGVPVVYLHLKRNEARPTSERDDTRSLAARARKRRQPRLLGALAGRASIAAGSDRPAARRINACGHASPSESRHYSRAEHSSEHCSRSKAYRRCWTYSIGASGGFPFRQLEGEGEGETGESREGRRSLPHRLHGRTREAMAGAAGTRRQPAAREGAWTERRSLRVRSR